MNGNIYYYFLKLLLLLTVVIACISCYYYLSFSSYSWLLLAAQVTILQSQSGSIFKKGKDKINNWKKKNKEQIKKDALHDFVVGVSHLYNITGKLDRTNVLN